MEVEVEDLEVGATEAGAMEVEDPEVGGDGGGRIWKTTWVETRREFKTGG